MATDQQINNLLQEIDKNQTTIDTNIKKKLLSLQNNNAVFTEALLKRIRKIMELIQGLKPKFSENAEKLRQKQEEIDKCNEAIQNYQSEIRTLNEKQSSQIQEISQKQLEIESLNSRIAELEEQINQLQGKINEFQTNEVADDEALQQELAENDARLREQLKPSDNNTPSNPSELYNQLEARKQELRNLELERNNLSRELSRVQESNTKLMVALTKINQKLIEHIQIISQIVADIPTMAPYEDDLNAIEGELQALLNSNLSGGKRRRKTKKMRGGYLYSRKYNSNSSSMSKSNSKSTSKSRTKSKTRSKKN